MSAGVYPTASRRFSVETEDSFCHESGVPYQRRKIPSHAKEAHSQIILDDDEGFGPKGLISKAPFNFIVENGFSAMSSLRRKRLRFWALSYVTIGALTDPMATCFKM